ncbi:hypothetical protein [Corynebacterium minutissimum]|uniref:Secreted protein n=1 Tax=Corynebacterium minutissimum TaxID=38301 RepID=A0A2X4RB54_9CORY|nr:hypothetical protein [Corynebacterium minutissimum]QPS60515.1 hypothetical protein I6G51_04785 [Corynebacterium minutissimum]QQA78697.1 hypothetical protein I6H49_08070 [Corynebacterium minutissimum]SQI00627.1 Uncharacterised protein [Corynebacterium minutissimum]VEG05305.1 Uncharacterised protein [Corynebacterium minutissimum]
MKKTSLTLATTALTGCLVLAGTTIASADEEATQENDTKINICWAPAAEFTTTVDEEEHTFKQESFGLWRAADNEDLTLNRAEVMEIAKADTQACGEQDEDAAKIQESIINNPPTSTTTTSETPTSETPASETPSTPSETPSQSETPTAESSSFDESLSSEDGEPTDLGIAAIIAAVLGVVGAIAAVAPSVAKSLGIKLPF